MKTLFLLAFVVILSGCTIEIDEDYPKEYGTYFDSLLGEWEVVQSHHDIYREKYSPLDSNVVFDTWDIEYIDSDGGVQQLHLDNSRDISFLLDEHLDDIFTEKFEEEIGSIPYERESVIVDVVLIDSNAGGSDEMKKDHFFETYQDAFHFNDLNLKNLVENTPYYLDIDYEFKDDEFTKEEQVKIVEEKEKEILSKYPKLNLNIEIESGYDKSFQHYYIAGEKVFLDPKEVAEEMHSEYVYQRMLRKSLSLE